MSKRSIESTDSVISVSSGGVVGAEKGEIKKGSTPRRPAQRRRVKTVERSKRMSDADMAELIKRHRCSDIDEAEFLLFIEAATDLGDCIPEELKRKPGIMSFIFSVPDGLRMSPTPAADDGDVCNTVLVSDYKGEKSETAVDFYDLPLDPIEDFGVPE